LAFDQGGDVAVVPAGEQVAFPVARHGAVGGLGRRSRIDTALTIWPRCCPVRVAVRARRWVRCERECRSNSCFSTPRAWMNRLRYIVSWGHVHPLVR
jgi:hypothetical protein